MEQYKTITHKGHADTVQVVQWSPDGKKLASGSEDCTIRLWMFNISTGTADKFMDLKGHTSSVDHLCWNPMNNDILASCSMDRTLRIWDSKTGKEIGKISNVVAGEVLSTCWSHDGEYVVVGNKANLLCLYETKGWRKVMEKQFDFHVNECKFDYFMSGDANKLFWMACGDGSVKIAQIPSLEIVEGMEMRGHTDQCYCVTLDPHGRYLWAGGWDACISMWDMEDLTCVRLDFGRSGLPIRTMDISGKGEWYATGTEDAVINIVEVKSGKLLKQVKSAGGTNSLSWNPRYRILAYASEDNDKYGKPRGTLNLFGGFIR